MAVVADLGARADRGPGVGVAALLTDAGFDPPPVPRTRGLARVPFGLLWRDVAESRVDVLPIVQLPSTRPILSLAAARFGFAMNGIRGPGEPSACTRPSKGAAARWLGAA